MQCAGVATVAGNAMRSLVRLQRSLLEVGTRLPSAVMEPQRAGDGTPMDSAQRQAEQ